MFYNPDLGPQLGQIFSRSMDFVNSFNYVGLISTIKTVFIVVTIIFGFLLAYIIYKMQLMIRKNLEEKLASVSPPEKAISSYNARWEEIKRHVESFSVAEWKLAVIEADKLVDDALKSSGFQGETMGERMTLISRDQIPEINNLWEAHKLRNMMVHDANYEARHNDAIAAVEVFERVLRELGGLS